jgi:ubiquinone/menaquinone biosynthesis C-methylase UbiE
VLQDRVPKDGVVLEVGCGSGKHGPLVRELGCRYIGTDFERNGADIFADAHSLPFVSECADAVIMYAVFQALENPFAASTEVARVLKPGGLLLGSGGGGIFDHSFFHITPFGLISLLTSQNIDVERIWFAQDALQHFGTNPGYPKVIRYLLRFLSKAAGFKMLAPRRFLSGAQDYKFMTAAGIGFVGQKIPR